MADASDVPPESGSKPESGSRPKPKPKARPRSAAAASKTGPSAPVADDPKPVTMTTSAEPTEEESEDEELIESGAGSFLLFTAMPSWLTSMIIHIIVILALALYALPALTRPKTKEIILGDNNDFEETLEDFQDTEIDTSDVEITETAEVVVETELVTEEPMITNSMDLTAAALNVDIDPLGSMSVMSSDLGKSNGVSGGEALDGRGQAARSKMVKEGGGSKGSEAAVAAGLKWIAEHQMPNGGWSLAHQMSPRCQGRCRDPGKKAPCSFGATGLALLPFLGAGQTHKEGDYKQVVDRGLMYLVSNIKPKNRNQIPCGALTDSGNYYSHGLCAIVLCEAYAMTKDRRLAAPAQALLNETVMAQDPVGGGWRYGYQSAGDTSAVGWQLMALKSGHMAYLNVPKRSIVGATNFLDSVQSKDGANYGYTDPSENWRYPTAAVGLLCRMYLGWKKDNPSLKKGVEKLAAKGPSKNDVYYNYYATQIMHHFGGETWKKWNAVMRDQLVNSQETKDHMKGSWMYHGGHANEAGGRLYCTSMSTMILEVYYRHMPIYKKNAAEDDFPL